MKHIKDAVAYACTQVVDADTLFGFQLLHGLYMAFRKVYHMDIISYACAVRCVIIISEYI